MTGSGVPPNALVVIADLLEPNAGWCGIDARLYGRRGQDACHIDGCQYRLMSMSAKALPNATPARATLEPLPVVDGLVACCTSLLDCCVSDEAATLAARAFKALSDPARLRLFATVAASETGEACVCDLVDTIDLSQPTVSHHLKVLTDAGLLERERRGSWAFYRVRDESVRDLAAILRG